jgi:TldD protein
MATRRDFIKQTTSTAAAVAVAGRGPLLESSPSGAMQTSSVSPRELCLVGLNVARSSGATYADVRVVDLRREFIATRESRVAALDAGESLGLGVRVLANGAWGFAASSTLTRDECRRVTRQAVAQARDNARVVRRPVALAGAVRSRPIRSTCRSPTRWSCCWRRIERRSV